MKKRNLFYELIKDIPSNRFIIITGARQVGKTTLLKQLLQYLKDRSDQVFYINLEDPDFLQRLNEHPKNIFSLFSMPSKGKVFFLIDEIQYLDQPSRFLKYLYDEYSDKIKLFVTGSSAFYLDAKFTDSLAGRKKIYTLNTLSLDEYLTFTGNEPLAEILRKIPYEHLTVSKLPVAYKRVLEESINKYIIFGGYPRVVVAEKDDEKIEILQDLIHSYVKKDILDAGIRNDLNVINLLRILASQCGSLLNINSLAKVMRLSHTSINNYLFVMRKSFILNTIQPFSRNIRNEIKKMPKVYFADLGLRNVLLKDFRPLSLRQDRGMVYENFIFRQFADRLSIDDIKFWRNPQGDEIDFILKNTLAIEVKYNAELIKTNKYKTFLNRYSDIPLKFIYHEGSPYDAVSDNYLKF